MLWEPGRQESLRTLQSQHSAHRPILNDLHALTHVITQQLHEVPTIVIHFTGEEIQTATCNLPKDMGKY